MATRPNHTQGGFFNCSAQISVLKRKTLFNQGGSFLHREFHGTESLIGCPLVFMLVLKIGGNSHKKDPVVSNQDQFVDSIEVSEMTEIPPPSISQIPPPIPVDASAFFQNGADLSLIHI